MSQHRRILGLVAVATLAAAAPLGAQDQFGRAVATDDGGVLVLKTGSGRGLAGVYRFAPDAGTAKWTLEQRIQIDEALTTGEGLSPSLQVQGGMLVVGSGDPSLGSAAHLFRRGPGPGADWKAEGAVPLREEPDSAAARTLDLAGLFQILQPPRRIVSADGDHLAVGVVGGPASLAGVHVYRRGPQAGPWVEETRLVADSGGRSQFGSSVDLRGGRLLVGAPNAGDGGEVRLYVREGNGWREAGRLAPDSAARGSRFGTAVLWAGNVALVGMPGPRNSAGSVVVYGADATGAWTLRATITAPDGAEGDAFGSALAWTGNELVVGAPLADSARGRVHRFVRDGDGAPWRAAGAVGGDEPRGLLGTSVALGRDVLIAGAPGARGGNGRAAVYRRAAGGAWGSAEWLAPDADLAAVSGGEMRCESGHAAGFECHNVDLEAYLPVTDLGGGVDERVSDVWGWTDPMTAREYALVGRTGALVFIDVTDPAAPVRVGEMPANRSGARDIKVYKDHAFLTGDGAGEHGLMVFDLTRLRDVTAPPQTFEPDTVYHEIASAHNLVIDTTGGYAYPVGASGGGNTCGGGLHMVDIRSPDHPTFAGCYTDTEGLIWKGRTHDAQCVVYHGPDTRHRGKQICFASNETALRIVDVTDKDNPVPIAAAKYPGMAYVHQGWLTEDQHYFYLDDELDELVGQAPRTRTMVWDVAELDDPVLVGEYLGPDGSTDHNLLIKGTRMYQANYQAGLRVVDLSDPTRPVEVGHFDTTPYEGNPPGFSGAWTAYPYFPSGTVIVTSMREGLFVLRPRPDVVP